MSPDYRIRAAAAQIPAHALHEADRALAAIEQAVQQAADERAELLVLPECAYPAYWLGSVERYRAAGVLPSDEFIVLLARWARKKRLHVVSGYVEDMGHYLYNSAVLIDDHGQVAGNYRKCFLWGGEFGWFRPGDRTRVCDTRLGRIGLVICADTRAPELIARQVFDGAQLIAMPTCWVNTAADRGGFENPQPEYLISARAAEFGIPFVCANKYGMETDKMGYCGRSILADRSGRLVAEAPGDQAAVLVALIAPRDRSADPAGPLWREVLATAQPQRPDPTRTGKLRLAICAGELDAAALARLAREHAEVVVASGQADDAALHDPRVTVLLPLHAGRIIDLPAGRIGCVAGADFAQFYRPRLMALQGACLICAFDTGAGCHGQETVPQHHAFDTGDDMKRIRTRAIENRTFVAVTGTRFAALVSPGGVVLARAIDPGEGPAVVDIDMAEAADKKVAPDTDIWEQRRIEACR